MAPPGIEVGTGRGASASCGAASSGRVAVVQGDCGIERRPLEVDEVGVRQRKVDA
jgi:hypothetical protein